MSTELLDKPTETITATNAVIYARISSVAQAQKGHGLASQETRCREYCRMKGYTVDQVFSDKAVSGLIANRKGITGMLDYIKAKKDKAPGTPFVVVIDDISRIARDIEAHLQLRRAISDAGASLESPSIEFGEDSDSILVENLLASVSQHQRQKGAEQTKNRMRARMMNGYWPFFAPIGYKFEKQAGRGKVLVRDEPLASVIQEALEGYACGRFQLQSEITRFFQRQPAFPKNRFGDVTHEATRRILSRLLYAGMLEKPEWGIGVMKAQHEGLISYETFLKIQERLNGKVMAPARADISNDFILRGAVDCASCGHPMTGSWSRSKSGKRHPYYMCFKKGCPDYRKSIRRDEMENAFTQLLTGLVPSRRIITFARNMLRDIWDQLQGQSRIVKAALERDIKATDTQIQKLLDKIITADNEAVISAYEKRIAVLEKNKAVMAEKLEKTGRPKQTFGEVFEHAMMFIANPRKLWDSGVMEYRKTVLNLCFAGRPQYCRKTGFRTPVSAYPFRVLSGLRMGESQMAEREGFEPSERLRAQRFSRPPRSTTPAPLQGEKVLVGGAVFFKGRADRYGKSEKCWI